MLIILRLAVLPHKHPHELLDSIVKERWLILSSQPRRAFYSSLIFRQAISKISFLLSTACAFIQLGASCQREANSTAFTTAVNLILQPRSLHFQTRQPGTTATLSTRCILRDQHRFATPLFPLTACFPSCFPRGPPWTRAH